MSRITIANQLRIDETKAHIKQFTNGFDTWIKGIKGTAIGSLINTPLNALELVVRTTIESITKDQDDLKAQSDKGEVYSKCRRVDRKTIWTHRVWDFYRERIDQRKQKGRDGMVAAADEVAWSCFIPAFVANADVPDVARGPSPLPYLEAFYSPRAFMVEVRPDQLNSDEDRTFFQKCLSTMPLPLVGVPEDCLNSPWLLVTLSHEIGHHVQHSLLPNRQLVKSFRDLVTTTVRNALKAKNLSSASAPDRWGDFSEEFFADLYAVTQLGEAAAWSIHEYVCTSTDELWKSPAAGNYPRPGVRQAILKHACAHLKITRDPAYGDWMGNAAMPQDTEAAVDMQIASDVVATVLATKLAGCASLDSIANLSLPSVKNVETLSSQLVGHVDAVTGQGEQSTREVISSGVRAYAQLVVPEIGDATVRRNNLVRQLPKSLVGTRKSTLRADEPETDTKTAVSTLWDLLKSDSETP